MLSTILAVLKFLAIYIPKFLDSYKKYKKDTKCKTSIEKTNAALKDFQKKVTVQSLKDLENSQ